MREPRGKLENGSKQVVTTSATESAHSVRVIIASLLASYRRQDWRTVDELAGQVLVASSASLRDKAVASQLRSKVHEQSGHVRQAVACLKQAVEFCPNEVSLKHELAAAHYRYGRTLRRSSELGRAVVQLQNALQLIPTSVAAHSLLGVVHAQSGNERRAEESYRLALQYNPRHARTLLNYGNLHLGQKRYEKAIESYRKSLDVRPAYVSAMIGAGAALLEVERSTPAIQLLERAIGLQPDNAEAHFNLGNAHFGARRFCPAAEHFGKALENKPGWSHALALWLRSRAETCDWRDDWQREIRHLQDEITRCLDLGQASPLCPSQAPALPISPALMRRISEQKAGEHMSGANPIVPARQIASASSERLRIGYLSCDLRHHAIGHLIHRAFKHHDRERFEVFVYSYGPNDESHYRCTVEQDSEHFVDLYQADDETMISRISKDKIDILVDLMGFSGHGRSKVLASRPAPLLVHYLGYPSSIGGLADYFITDPVATPQANESASEAREFVESLIYLPHTYQINALEPVDDMRIPSRAQCGLPEDGFVFCSFNNNYKIQPDIFQVWMRILTHVPTSVLWLLTTQPETESRLRAAARRSGVDAERLVFADVTSKQEHMARHKLADLFLDTPVCNAHTTASDSLQAGVPILTCCGKRFTERVAASLLTAADLQELIVDNLDDYETLAVQLACDSKRLHKIREDWMSRIAESRLVDTAARVHELEAAYNLIWSRYIAGLPPSDLHLSTNDVASND